MNNKKSHKLSPPLNISKEAFIHGTEPREKNINTTDKGRVQAFNITLNSADIEILEKQIDRATMLDKRSKNRSTIVRMALRALRNTSDNEYLELYDQF